MSLSCANECCNFYNYVSDAMILPIGVQCHKEMLQMSNPQQQHWKPLVHLIKYVMGAPERGLTLAPNCIWNGDMDFEFCIAGRSDSHYAANTDDSRSVSGGCVFIEAAPACFRTATQSTAQDRCIVTITSLGLKVEQPMVLEMDNKGDVDY
jgi:hypothetical protein